jgi:acetyl esterase
MHPLIQLGLRLRSLPIFDVKRNYDRIRRAQEAMSSSPEDLAKEIRQEDYYLLDNYLLSDRSESHIPIRVFAPKNPTDRQAGIILFFHGGGYVTGNVDTYTEVCLDLSEYTRRIVLSVDYRLAPENPYPAGLDDCYEVAQEILSYFHEENNVPGPYPVFLMGDSAGGNLASSVAQKLIDKCLIEGEEKNCLKPDGLILLYPALGYDYSDKFAKEGPFPSLWEKRTGFGLTLQNMRDYYDLYLENDALLAKDPYVSPLLIKNPDLLSALPPSLIITAEHDPLRDEGLCYAFRLARAGVDVDASIMRDVPHGFFDKGAFFPQPQTRVFEKVKNFIDRIQAELLSNSSAAPAQKKD